MTAFFFVPPSFETPFGGRVSIIEPDALEQGLAIVRCERITVRNCAILGSTSYRGIGLEASARDETALSPAPAAGFIEIRGANRYHY